jgi:hypothetical protein
LGQSVFSSIWGLRNFRTHFQNGNLKSGFPFFRGTIKNFKIILRTLWWNEVESQLEQCTLVPCQWIGPLVQEEQKIVRIKYKTPIQWTYIFEQDEDYVSYSFFPGSNRYNPRLIHVNQHLNGYSGYNKLPGTETTRRWLNSWGVKMCCESTAQMQRRHERRTVVFGPIWEKKHENSSCYHDSYHDSWYMLVKPIQD